MTAIAELLSNATGELQHSDSAALDAELLLAHCLQAPRSHLYAWPEREVDSAVDAAYQALITRRVSGEPVAYILGEREFWSLPLAVTPDTLIPRPDTETLVAHAIAVLQQNNYTGPVLDLGSGSGAIALALAKELPALAVTGVDCDAASVALAARNAAALGISNAAFMVSDWFDALAGRHFDLIVSNPPYIAADDPHLQQGDVRFEPLRALVSGADGLDAIRAIVRQAPDFLCAGGGLMFEHGYQQAAGVRGLLAAAGFTDVVSVTDVAGIERVSGGRLL